MPSSSGCTITVDLHEYHQGIGHEGAHLAVLASNNAGTVTIQSINSTTLGGGLTVQAIASGADVLIQAQRTGASSLATTVAPVVMVIQGENTINTKRISVD